MTKTGSIFRFSFIPEKHGPVRVARRLRMDRVKSLVALETHLGSHSGNVEDSGDPVAQDILANGGFSGVKRIERRSKGRRSKT